MLVGGEVTEVGVEGDLVVARFEVQLGVVGGLAEVFEDVTEDGEGLLEGHQKRVDTLAEVVHHPRAVPGGVSDKLGGEKARS